MMKISAAYARELEKQKQRKTALKADCAGALEGVERIVFEAIGDVTNAEHDAHVDEPSADAERPPPQRGQVAIVKRRSPPAPRARRARA